MREIKFRAWDIEILKMVENPYFFEVYHYSDENRVNQKTYRYYEDWRDLEDGRGYECELMQYTGLKDKNGKEIYEGDIIHIQAGNPYDVIEGKHIVEWSLSGWYIKLCDGIDYTDVDFSDLSLYNFVNASEVIGNIYEHKHLLK